MPDDDAKKLEEEKRANAQAAAEGKPSPGATKDGKPASQAAVGPRVDRADIPYTPGAEQAPDTRE